MSDSIGFDFDWPSHDQSSHTRALLLVCKSTKQTHIHLCWPLLFYNSAQYILGFFIFLLPFFLSLVRLFLSRLRICVGVGQFQVQVFLNNDRACKKHQLQLCISSSALLLFLLRLLTASFFQFFLVTMFFPWLDALTG